MNFLSTEITLPDYIPVTAWLEHGPFAMWLVRKMKPARIVELGTHYGYSYFAMCQAVEEIKSQTECFAVDTWVGEEHAGFYDESVFDGVFEENSKYSGFSHLLRNTFADALSDLEDGSVDLLHVDGRHYYDDVKEDFESWIPKLSSSAVVLFHDTEVRERNFGVYRYWEEIAETRPSINFRHCHGLGVLFWGKDIPEGLRDLAEMAENPPQNALVVDYFAAAGGKLVAMRQLKDRDAQIQGHRVQLEDRDAQIQGHRVQLEDLQARLVDAEHQRQLSDAAAQLAKHLPEELADARQRPGKSFRRKYESRLLYFLARQATLFTQRRRNKFWHSARKRDPKRSLPEFASISNGSEPVAGDVKSAVLARSPSAQLKKDAKTVMVVSHDATRTGAPILALNLVRELSKRYNVVSVILNSGELLDDFAASSVNILLLNRNKISTSAIASKVAQFSERNEVYIAFINSVESRYALPGLKRAGVTSVALLHEFASYTRPQSAFPDVFKNADQVVFSTSVTLDNALSEWQGERPINIQVLPQGKCAIPTKESSKEEQKQEKIWLNNVLRPGGADDSEFVVIGAGTIETRKGIDLFIETATRVIDSAGGARFRFVWFGQGYDPVNDTRLSVYLADQIKRAGLGSQMQIVRATSEIEQAYAVADLMLLSSRLDPLPNVAIDMLLAGKPVMCFARTTGIADFLDDCGLGEACVAKYLDTTEMAEKIRALAGDPDVAAEVAALGKKCARATFDFPTYVDRLDSIANLSGLKSDRINQDLQYIVSSGEFRSDFCRSVAKPNTAENDLIRGYLEANRNGPQLRKPTPGFNQLIYAEENGWGAPEDPFVQFLKADRPAGRWSLKVIDECNAVSSDAVRNARVALHIHAYFLEELSDILNRLKVTEIQPSLFVSTTDFQLDAVKRILEDYTEPVDVQTVQNRGRDIAPLLTVFGPKLVDNFDIIGHLHTKRSLDIGNRKTTEAWVNFQMENTIGGPSGGAMLDRIVTAMWETPDIGIVYPDDPNVMGWNENRGYAADIAARMGIHHLPDSINFPMGSMFWMKPELLKKFVDMRLDWDDYPAEPLGYDGSMLHAIERLFGVVPGLVGLKSGVTNVRGVTR